MRRTSILFLAGLLAACSSPQDPTEENFTAAIQNYYDQSPVCFKLNVHFPYELNDTKYNSESDKKVFNELEAIGFLNSSKTANGVTFALTDEGKEKVKRDEFGDIPHNNSTFCYGSYKVVAVSDATKQGEEWGHIFSVVKFKLEMQDVDSWVKESDVLKEEINSIQKNIDDIGSVRKSEAAVILTNNGWVHSKLFYNDNT